MRINVSLSIYRWIVAYSFWPVKENQSLPPSLSCISSTPTPTLHHSFPFLTQRWVRFPWLSLKRVLVERCVFRNSHRLFSLSLRRTPHKLPVLKKKQQIISSAMYRMTIYILGWYHWKVAIRMPFKWQYCWPISLPNWTKSQPERHKQRQAEWTSKQKYHGGIRNQVWSCKSPRQ